MYSSIPTSDLIEIIKSLSLEQGHNLELTNELVNITRTILRQNYFQFQISFYVQKTGLAIGAPTSSIFSEVFLQHIEHTAIYDILVQNKILGYFRYIDDILIAYNGSTTNIHDVFDFFNSLVPTLKFTMENEVKNRIHFLDITIQKEKDCLSFNIHRKPTTTDTIIPGDSCHPYEQNMAAIRYLTNRMNMYHLSETGKEVEKNTIEHILRSNNYNTSVLKQFNNSSQKMEHAPNKWAKFTYIGKETKFITKLFKNSSVKVAFTTNNTIRKCLSIKPNQVQKNRFGKSGVYQLTCPDCNMKYVGQTSCPFQV
jgi:hypothetical protein